MYLIKRINNFFWLFLLLVVLLQLSADKTIPFLSALLYSMGIVITLRIYVHLLSGRKAVESLFRLNTFSLLGTMGALSTIIALILWLLGYVIVKLTVDEEATRIILEDWPSLFFGLFIFVVLVTGLNYSFNQYKRFLEQEKELEVVKRKSLEMEIGLLRNQLSPHFTFNVLNNLQFLIIKDKGEALTMLSRYSKILQYYVYESQKEYISLDREVTFLKEYFDLEIDRHVSDLHILCEWNISENNFNIAPFIISTFVENAFKHVFPNQANDYFIRQTFYVDQSGELVFEITNTFDKVAMIDRQEGVGLKQVQERLKLLYDNNFKLIIQETNEIFSVRLELNLK
ncbi:hypothetical protein CMU43_14140 [Elizabethkingia anophelis]|nr:hypothetical protein [Elizabethkingia anophelis]